MSSLDMSGSTSLIMAVAGWLHPPSGCSRLVSSSSPHPSTTRPTLFNPPQIKPTADPRAPISAATPARTYLAVTSPAAAAATTTDFKEHQCHCKECTPETPRLEICDRANGGRRRCMTERCAAASVVSVFLCFSH
jgi:hypothetical protein